MTSQQEFLTGLGRMVFPSALAGYPLLYDQAYLGKGFESLRENGGRDHRQPALKLTEASPAHQDLANDENRPFLADDLGGLRNGAKLSVFHV